MSRSPRSDSVTLAPGARSHLTMLASMTITVAVCDDSPLARSALASYFAADEDITLVGAFATGTELLQHLEQTAVDVVLVDLRMPEMDGAEVAARVRRKSSDIAVIYLTSYPDAVPLDDARGGKVAGALTKDIPPEELLRAVHLAAHGVSVISQNLLARDVARHRENLAQSESDSVVLELLCRGLTNDEIAARMYRSLSWVKHAVSDLCRRAGSRVVRRWFSTRWDGTSTRPSRAARCGWTMSRCARGP